MGDPRRSVDLAYFSTLVGADAAMRLLRRAGLRERATLLWNANNGFGFERIDWPRLAGAAVLTTVSRYMKHAMRPLGVNPIVIPNGLAPEAYGCPERAAAIACTCVSRVHTFVRGSCRMTAM